MLDCCCNNYKIIWNKKRNNAFFSRGLIVMSNKMNWGILCICTLFIAFVKIVP